MAQALPHSHAPAGRRLRLILAEQPWVNPEGRRLVRGLLLIALAGGIALGYLCFLVRVSTVDVACHQLETQCEELGTVIAADMTELSSLSDAATSLDRAQHNGLCPVEGRDRIPVSAALCPPRAAEGESGSPGAEADTPTLVAGLSAH